ncbi:MAG: amino acid adenylation domain-containing protein [Ardenticatenaceae bacterium]|nr:amino acid adenylation domain-containing protein [Ardenticatenaceae bacterium]
MFSCYLIGETSLLIQCGEILREQGQAVWGVISPDTAVAEWAAERDIRHWLPGEDWGAVLGERPFDYLFSVVNGTIIPESVLNLPQKLAINYHDAPLPRYAGVYATSWAILNGEREHGVSWHVMTAVVDAGDILQQVAVPIAPDETALTLNAKCYEAALGSFALLVRQLTEGTAVRQPQDLSERTYFGLWQRPSTVINWQESAAKISALVRGLDFGPYGNALGLAKVAVGTGDWGLETAASLTQSPVSSPQSLFVVRQVVVLDVRSGEGPGVVTAVAPYRVQVATATYDVVLTQLVGLDGQPVYELPVQVGDKLPILEIGWVESLREQHEKLARHENYWRKKLVQSQPVSLPPSATSMGDRLRLSVVEPWFGYNVVRFSEGDEWAIATFLAFIARLSGLRNFTIGWEVENVDGRFLATTVPFHVEVDDDWEIPMIYLSIIGQRLQLVERKTYMRDLVLRYGELEPIDFPLRLRREGDDLILLGEGIGGWATALSTLVQAIIENPSLPLREMPLLTEAEKEGVLRQYRAEFPYSYKESVVEMFAARVAERPSALAAICGDEQLTYGELDIKANELAQQLQAVGVKAGVPVGVYVRRGLDVLVAVWGIWRAGGVYVPLDPEYPAERLRFMMGDVGTAVVITQSGLLASLPGTTAEIVVLDPHPSPPPVRGRGKDSLSFEGEARGEGEGVAYVIYTSGSTGRPKGVMVGHEAIAAHCASVQTVYQIQPEDRVLQFSSYSFDTSIEQMLVALLNGATLVMRGEEVWGAQEAAAWLARQGVTVANLPTAYWHSLVVGWGETAVLPPNNLRLMIVGGEAMQPEMVRLWRQSALAQVRLLNAYGPTETTVTALVWEIGEREKMAEFEASLGIKRAYSSSFLHHSDAVPIGRPLPGRTAVVLDRFGQLVPIGVPGELCLGGIGLARGYVKNYELGIMNYERGASFIIHNSSFLIYKTGDLVRMRPDGVMVFVGRVDEQVKVRGYRIELGEIERVLRQVAGVAETAVLVREDAPGDKQIVAYVTGMATTEQCHNYLITQLPHYMIPSAIVRLEVLPLSPNGKIDRKALPAPEVARRLFVPLRGAVEQEVAGLWTAVLGAEALGREDNFFELGGDSLRATRLVAQVSRVFRVEMALQSLFAQPTVGAFAAELVRCEPKPGQVATIARLRQEIGGMDGAEVRRQIEARRVG